VLAFAVFAILWSVVAGVIAAVVIGVGVGVAYGTVMRAAAVPGLLRLSGARPVTDTEFPRYTNLIEGLCISSGIAEPELFVLEGSFADEGGRFARGTWLRLPPGSAHSPVAEQGCVLYIKEGGFAYLNAV